MYTPSDSALTSRTSLLIFSFTISRLPDVDRILIVGHSLNIAGVNFAYEVSDDENTITVTCTVKTMERMRAESPALLGCGCALISIIDRLRLMDRSISVE